MSREQKVTKRGSEGQSAFSLIEILVVMAIMAIMVSLVVPMFKGVMEGGRVTQAATILANQFSLGHLKAIAENRPITLRFIRKDASSSFDRVQLISTDAHGNLLAVDRVSMLPTGTAIARSVALSSLLDSSLNPEKEATSSDLRIPNFGTSYRYIQFSFRPRGSLDLDITRKWFATLVLLRDDLLTGTPANYITLQLDPVNGNFVMFQP